MHLKKPPFFILGCLWVSNEYSRNCVHSTEVDAYVLNVILPQHYTQEVPAGNRQFHPLVLSPFSSRNYKYIKDLYSVKNTKSPCFLPRPSFMSFAQLLPTHRLNHFSGQELLPTETISWLVWEISIPATRPYVYSFKMTGCLDFNSSQSSIYMAFICYTFQTYHAYTHVFQLNERLLWCVNLAGVRITNL